MKRSNDTKQSRYRKPVKCPALILLSAALAAGTLAGCGKGESGNEDSLKGRYIEEDLELPVQEGEAVLNIAKSEDGNLLLYSQTEEAQVFRYEYEDGEWEQTSLDWISQVFEGRDVYLQEIWESADGVQVAAGMGGNMDAHIARSMDGQTGEELEIPYLKQEGEFGYPAVTNLQIDGEGNYWMTDFYQAKAMVVNPDTLEITREFSTARGFSNIQRIIAGASNGDMALNSEEGVFTIYGSDLKEKGTFKIDQEKMPWVCNVEENWYLLTEEGITRLKPGNETREVIVDGSMGKMGSSLNYAAGFIAGQKEDFYALYRQEKADACSLVHYTYDTEAHVAPEHTLRVFGLSDHTTVQDAILSFQKSHPDVKVEFETSEKEDGITMDDIRTLNTELLGGNGADVLLLDGLPAETYIEKGLLSDLTGVTDELLSQETYLESILKNVAQKDGKIYGLPVRFSVPIIFGDESAKEAILSLDKLIAYVDAHPDKSILGIAERDYIRDFLFQMYQDEIIGADGRVDQERLAALLETEVKLAAVARSEVFEDAKVGETGMNTMTKLFRQGMFSNAGSGAILNHPDRISTDRIVGVTNMMIPYTIMRQLKLTPDTVKEFYVPSGIVGINKNTQQKELAEEFVKYLFSPEIQEKQLDDGLPVLETALDRLKDEVETEYAQSYAMTSAWNIEGEEPIEIEAGYPTAKEVEDLISKCHTLSVPAVQDCVIWNIYQTEADACLGGSTDAKTAAKNIAQKVDMYLAE